MSPPHSDTLRAFGRLSDGREVRAATLSRPGGLRVEVIEYGATVRSLRAPTAAGEVDVATGFETLAEYEADSAYHGCIVGRCANRIDGAAFEIDGERFEVTRNEGSTCLHGGKLGLSKRLWRFNRVQETGCTLTYDSPDREEGFPGRLSCRVELDLVAPDALQVVWEARTDQPTPVNLTYHLYFNLTGGIGPTILDHELTIAADAITPVDDKLIPTGELLPVVGTPFDFRAPRRIGDGLAQSHPQLKPGGGYDHNWALTSAKPALRLRSPETGLALEIETDQPGMQLYGGQGLKPPFAPYGAMALEPQGFPDAINRPSFPSVLLRPGETYRRRALYRLKAGPPGRSGPA